MEIKDNDVISMDSDAGFTYQPMFKYADMIQGLKEKLNKGHRDSWFGDGVECELLREGGKWQKGKFRLRLEFIPDEESSPLDDLRAKLNNE